MEENEQFELLKAIEDNFDIIYPGPVHGDSRNKQFRLSAEDFDITPKFGGQDYTSADEYGRCDPK